MILVSYGLWSLMIVLKYSRLKKGVFDLLWIGIVTTVYGLARFDIIGLNGLEDWMVYGGVFGSLLFFDLSAIIRGKDDSETFKSLEAKHQSLLSESEHLRKRFITTLDILEDGVMYKDHAGNLFLTEKARQLFQRAEPEWTEDAFFENLHPDDQPALKDVHKKALNSGKKYTTKYRFKGAKKYIWITEVGQTIRLDKHPLSVAQVRGSEVRLFPKTDVDVLNYMLQESDLNDALMHLHQTEKPYTAIAIRLTNIPGINAKYGRDVGDMMMGEFLKKMKFHFMKEDSLYRLQGILFFMMITDERKAEMIVKALQEDSSLLQTTITLGGVNESVYPYFGLVRVQTFTHHALDVKTMAMDALRNSLSEDLQENFTIKEV